MTTTQAPPESRKPTVPLRDAIDAFLSQRRIAVVGVSRSPGQTANAIYRRFRERGYEVFAVNPNAETVEGDPCFPDLRSIPGGVGAVLVVTAPAVGERILADCAELGIAHVWLHRALGQGSYSAEAVAAGRAHGIAVIPGGCPLMFGQTADTPHRLLMGPIAKLTGRLPRRV